MEMKYILYAKVHTTKEAGEAWTFKFQPTEEDFKNVCSFSVTTKDPYTTMGQLNLPQDVGDIILLSTKKKNVQGKLPKGDKKAVE
ncbi:unnamed protein product [marine sediment metagenome]|uniref:Uncharacterized protein n=1 Tax=marine sediment metagenome TaxID=412755 RepID=X0VHW0_9ZZZZ